jgi:hypothetical protein
MRPKFLLTLFFTLVGGPSLMAQSLWSPCGCPGQCGADQTSACQSQANCQGGCGGCGGCLNLYDPAYFQPWNNRPFGLYNERIYDAQRNRGIRAQFVFQQVDFSMDEASGTWHLTQTGQRTAQKLARLWTIYPSQILVEPSGSAEGDSARRDLALQAMVSQGVTVTSEAFVTGSSHILGLVPHEPESIFARRQQLSPYMQGSVAVPSVGSAGMSSPSLGGSDSSGSGAGSSSGSGSNSPY